MPIHSLAMTDAPRPATVRAALLFVVALVVAGALLGSTAGTVRASEEERGTVTFRLVIEGPISEDDAFWLRRASDQCCFIDASVNFCGPPAAPPSIVESCDVRIFEIAYVDEFAVGTTITYTYLRVRDADATGASARDGETLLAGEVVVSAQPQLITLTYQYPDPSAPVLLPDTATGTAPMTSVHAAGERFSVR